MIMRLRVLLAIFLLVACGEPSTPAHLPPTPTAFVFTPIGDALAQGMPPTGIDLTTVGYIVVDDAGARLIDGLSFSAGPTPQPLSDRTAQIWIATNIERPLEDILHRAGTVRYALVLARGRLEGPGTYGPGGDYRYRMNDPHLQPLDPQETTIAVLTDSAAAYEGRVVRIIGALLTRADSALLVERLGAGGLPAPGARQIKLRGPLRDRALLGRLHGAPGGTVHFGQVQVEGFWRGGILTPLSLLPIL
jgi:hypothetical protein